MLTHERKRLILDRLKLDGRIIAKELSAKLKLSEDTIRRDLRELAAAGLLHRVHGGALPASPTVVKLDSRRTMSVEEKARLGRAGAALIESGQSVFIDGGTTHMELVWALPADLHATIYTHSPIIAAALEHHHAIELILIGGKLFRHSMVSVGAATLQAIADLRVDLFFLGVTGVHDAEGLTTGDFEEAVIKRAIVARSGDVVSLVTSEKIGTASSHRVCDLAALSTLVVASHVQLPNWGKIDFTILRSG